MARPPEHDFSPKTKRELAHRAGNLCSNPDCETSTSGPSEESPSAILNIGEASHIKGAAPGARRYDPLLDAQDCRHINNGIWLCRNCAAMIDRDENTYTVEVLRQWKSDAETRAKFRNGKKLREIARDLHTDTLSALIVDKTYSSHAQFLKEKGIGMIVRNGEPEYFPEGPMTFEIAGNVEKFIRGVQHAAAEGEFEIDLEAANLTLSTADKSLHSLLPPIRKGKIRLELPAVDIKFFLVSGTDFEVIDAKIKALRKPEGIRLDFVSPSTALSFVILIRNLKVKFTFNISISKIDPKKDLPFLRAFWILTNSQDDVVFLDAINRGKIITFSPRIDMDDQAKEIGFLCKVAEEYFKTIEIIRKYDGIRNELVTKELFADFDNHAYSVIQELKEIIRLEQEGTFNMGVFFLDTNVILSSLRSEWDTCKVSVYFPLNINGKTLTVMMIEFKKPTLELYIKNDNKSYSIYDSEIDAFSSEDILFRFNGSYEIKFLKDQDLAAQRIRFTFSDRVIDVDHAASQLPKDVPDFD